MTAPSLGRLLISHITLRGPELAQLYALIAERPGVSYDELTDALMPAGANTSSFGLEEAPLREALNFLLVARLVEQQGPSRRKARFLATSLLADTPFALLLLRHIEAHSDERQRAPALIYRQLVTDDVLAITPAVLREQMERGAHRSLFIWTSEKISFWGHLAAYIGLICRSEREAELLVVPQPGLALAALRWASGQASTSSLDALLEVIDANLFACFTSRGRLHRGLTQTLLALDRLGHIRLAHSADAARSLMLGERRVSEVWINESGCEHERVWCGQQPNHPALPRVDEVEEVERIPSKN
jgi:hypothetical protein